MVRVDTVTESRTIDKEREGAVLAAALAATLVEYRRHVGRQNVHEAPEHTGANWRMVARIEQLRGPS
jgi:hypothetical protein